MKKFCSLHAWGKWFLPGLPALLLIAGCRGGDDDASKNLDDVHASPMDDQRREELYLSVMESLGRLEEFQAGTMHARIRIRIDQRSRIEAPPGSEEDVLMAAWPEPEMLQQIVDRLNQWADSPKAVPDWQVDPMLADLPPSLVKSPLTDGLDRLEFVPFDGFALREAAWLHDASNRARGNRRDPLQQARRLFDWTVRNIQLERRTGDSIPRFPWETLLFGRGTPLERMWVFILLARQQGIDAAMLALEEPLLESPPGTAAAQPRPLQPWVVAVLRRDRLYLFEPLLGLPIPAPNGLKLGASGELIVEPATLDQVLRDETLLDRLSPDSVSPDPRKLSELKKKRIVVLVEGSPSYLARRMKMIESHPKQQLVLTASPQAQAKRFREASPHLADARLWDFPFETIRERSQLTPPRIATRLRELLPFYADPAATLGTARMFHIRGKLSDAVGYYMQAWVSDNELDEIRAEILSQYAKQWRRENPDAPEDDVRQLARTHARIYRAMLRHVRRDAAYWLGMISQEQGDYDAAIDYLADRTLKASPGGPWTNGATYNLARCYEASGQRDKAVELYRRDTASPGRAGNLLRAQWIESLKGP